MLIKYKGKLYEEVKTPRKSFVDSATAKPKVDTRAIARRAIRNNARRSFVDAELSGNEVSEYIAEIKGKVSSYVRAIEGNINETLDRLSRKSELDYSDVEQAVIKAVEHFLETPSASITDF